MASKRKRGGKKTETPPEPILDEPEVIEPPAEVEAISEIADKTTDEPKTTEFKIIEIRAVFTGPILAAESRKQLNERKVTRFGDFKIGPWTFGRNVLKTVYLTPEIQAGIDKGLFEGYQVKPPGTKVDEE